jgi:hypothetical protein
MGAYFLNDKLRGRMLGLSYGEINRLLGSGRFNILSDGGKFLKWIRLEEG